MSNYYSVFIFIALKRPSKDVILVILIHDESSWTFPLQTLYRYEKGKMKSDMNEESCNCTVKDMVKVEKYGKQLPWILSAFIAIVMLYISTIRL